MTKPAFKKPGKLESFSVVSLFATAQDRDWSVGYAEDYEIVLPAFTLDAIAQHAEDLLSVAQKAQAKADRLALAPADLADEFQQSDGYDGFRDSFDPMMNYAWPVELGYEVEVRDAALLMSEFAPSCSLVERKNRATDEWEYEIALNGGGMNLADHIAGAYLCCGALPPVAILDSLSGSLPSYLLPRLPMAEVYAEAQAFLLSKAERLGDELRRIQESATKAA